MPARRHLERQHGTDGIAVRHDVDHAECAAEVGEADAAAIGAGLLDESNWLRRVDRDGADRTCPRVHEARGVPVGPDLDDAASCDELEVLTAATARDLLIVRALVQDADASG